MSMWGFLLQWQADRRASRRRDKEPPGLTEYVDPPADCLVAVTRLVMGAGVGGLLADQVSGPIAAIAVGAAAPALLRQIGSAKTMAAAQQRAEALGAEQAGQAAP